MEPELTDLGHEILRHLGPRSQRWLAEQSGINQGTISRLMRGKHEPTPSTLDALGRALNVDPLHLMRLAGLPLPTAHLNRDARVEYTAQRLNDLIQDLPAELQDAMIDAVSGVVQGFSAFVSDRTHLIGEQDSLDGIE
jgi:transcriptional regulator with XRE-family HTH domain